MDDKRPKNEIKADIRSLINNPSEGSQAKLDELFLELELADVPF